MRGKPLGVLVAADCGRIIPAHAGQTTSFVLPAIAVPDHPRACGANGSSDWCRCPICGSSPRMRGKQACHVRARSIVRIIPAHAGQTAAGCPRWARIRIIPAHAGQTDSLQLSRVANSDHPRACGANLLRPQQPRCGLGSSPRMRGKRDPCTIRLSEDRIIPAHAGQTTLIATPKPSASDHPRACGANYEKMASPEGHVGSSPRMRGKLGAGLSDTATVRIIPAHAGQTLAL